MGTVMLLAMLVLLAQSKGSAGGRVAPTKARGGLEAVWRVASLLDDEIPGFAVFATAAAAGESGGNNLVGLGGQYYGQYVVAGSNRSIRLNMGEVGEREQKAATKVFQDLLAQGYFASNPYTGTATDVRAWWCFGSGGWFGLLPGSGMKAGGKNGPFANEHPSLIFDPGASTVMIADYIARLAKTNAWASLPPSQRNWLAIRRGMRAVTLIADYNEESSTSAGVRERFHDKLVDIGVDPDFMFSGVSIATYSGATRAYETIQNAFVA